MFRQFRKIRDLPTVLWQLLGQTLHRLAKRVAGSDPELVSRINELRGELIVVENRLEEVDLAYRQLEVKLAQVQQELEERVRAEKQEAREIDVLRKQAISLLAEFGSWRTKIGAANNLADLVRKMFEITPEEERQGTQLGSQTPSQRLASFFAKLPSILRLSTES